MRTILEYYADQLGPGGRRVVTQTAKQLAEPRPDDLPGVGPRGLPRAGSALAGLGSGGGRLQAYVHALGGRVHLVAELPGRDVEIIVARPGT